MIKTKHFENSKIFLPDLLVEVKNLEWKAHTSFQGVYLKHLITGFYTKGKISCHLVKIEADCEIGLHSHDNKIELHEIIKGNGKCFMQNKTIDYNPGNVVYIPENTDHCVKAGEFGLFLLAKFIPALL